MNERLGVRPYKRNPAMESLYLVREGPADPSALLPLVFTAATSTVARDGMIVDCASIKLDNYRRNPVFLWGHRSDLLPIGKAKCAIDGDKLRISVEFDQGSRQAREIERLYREGFLAGVSIGWAPGRIIQRNQLAKTDPYYSESESWRSVVHYDSELLEVSAVPVPADAQALLDGREYAPECVRSLLSAGLPYPGEQGGLADALLEQLRSELGLTPAAAGRSTPAPEPDFFAWLCQKETV
jgi:hypothetical protein